MAEHKLQLVRTVFLPKGSPGICTVREIRTDVRHFDLTCAEGKIYCKGELDLLIEYLSFAGRPEAVYGSNAQDGEYPSGGGKLWQALLTLPFELVEALEIACPPLARLVVGEVKWYMVAPRALEMEIELILRWQEAGESAGYPEKEAHKTAYAKATRGGDRLEMDKEGWVVETLVEEKQQEERAAQERRAQQRRSQRRPMPGNRPDWNTEREAGRQEMAAGEAERLAGLQEMEAGEAERQAGLREMEAGLAEREAGLAEREAGLAEAAAGEAERQAGLYEMEMGEAERAMGLHEMEAGLAEREAGLREMEAGLAEHEAGLREREVWHGSRKKKRPNVWGEETLPEETILGETIKAEIIQEKTIPEEPQPEKATDTWDEISVEDLSCGDQAAEPDTVTEKATEQIIEENAENIAAVEDNIMKASVVKENTPVAAETIRKPRVVVKSSPQVAPMPISKAETASEVAAAPAPLRKTSRAAGVPQFQVKAVQEEATAPISGYKVSFYRVRLGDTLAGIALKTGVAAELLIEHNSLQNQILEPGMILRLP